MAFCLTFIFVQTGAFAENFVLPEPPIPVREMQTTAYSKAFAKRFNLPDPQSGQELELPLEALRFSIGLLHFDPVLDTPTYGCSLQVYFDKALSVAYPSRSKTWTRQIYTSDRQGWLDQRRNGLVRVPDQITIAQNESLGNMLVALASRDYRPDKVGFRSTSIVKAVDRELVSGIAYFDIGLSCPRAAAISMGLEMELWIKKEDAPDFRRTPLDPKAFHKLPIPRSLFAPTVPWLKWYEERTLRAGDEVARRNRESRKSDKTR